MGKQVNKEHYFQGYDSVERFISYFYQCSEVIKLNPKTVLEIGMGNGLTRDYISKHKIKVTTCDIDKDLKPDVIANVTKLPFSKNKFDCVVAYQILEHLPFENFERALKEIARVSSKNAIISLPYSSVSFEFIIKLPLISKLIKKQYLDLFFRVPKFYQEHKFDGQHYWEIGKKGYSLNKIRGLINKYFIIKKDFRPEINSYHYFFILEKRI